MWVQKDALEAFRKHQSLLYVFFYMQKAYNTTWWYGILRKSMHYDFEETCLITLGIFCDLERSEQRLVVKYPMSMCSSSPPIGKRNICTLFSVAINNTLTVLPLSVKESLYADDFMVYTTRTYYPGLERRLHVAINNVANWASNNEFVLSLSKTFSIQFHRKLNLQPPL